MHSNIAVITGIPDSLWEFKDGTFLYLNGDWVELNDYVNYLINRENS